MSTTWTTLPRTSPGCWTRFYRNRNGNAGEHVENPESFRFASVHLTDIFGTKYLREGTLIPSVATASNAAVASVWRATDFSRHA
jgi:hypothetical protein